QRRQLGTADALKMVMGLLNDKFLMISGDVIIRKEEIRHLIAEDDITMSIIRVDDASGLGVVETQGERVVRIYEKMDNPPSKLANSGVYLFTPDIFDAVAQTTPSSRGEYEITDSIQKVIDTGHKVLHYEIQFWLDFSYPWDLLKANELMMKSLKPQIDGEVEQNTVLKGAMSIGKNTVVRSGSYIVGPVRIGENCEIGPNCYIRPSTSIGDGCHVGASVEVKNSIIMNGSKVPHLNYVGDSVIGENCNLGAGTKIANLKLDKSNVVVGGIDTGRRKLGAIIGDNVQTGINASINIGSVIGNDVMVGPGALAHGIIAPKSRIL
ncbi:bifunctional sugar-1-phosphate nucleotidylyltransferase/acetyltransferase, partial [Chloroflexota bacterium]